jgi:superoxide dismutase, Fe-Mn family
MHKLPELSYAFSALEPVIDARTMEIHYTKHHQGYVDKLNGSLSTLGQASLREIDPETLLRNLNEVPSNARMVVRNNGGGHYNHSLFWSVMGPGEGGSPAGKLLTAIEGTYGSLSNFQDLFETTANTRFGSGWAWAYVDHDRKLEVVSCANQDNPIIEGLGTPILGLDVWEHAYYLAYQNRRPEYVSNFWSLVNWKEVGRRYKECMSRDV